MEEYLTIGVLVLSIAAAIMSSYFIYKQTGKKLLSLIPSLVILLVGAVITIAMFIDAATTPGSWADLAGFIIAMMTLGAVLISIIGTLVMILIVNRRNK